MLSGVIGRLVNSTPKSVRASHTAFAIAAPGGMVPTSPLVLLALHTKSELPPLLRDAGTFAVNLLATGQQDLARTFAPADADPFAGVGWALDGGAPRLDGAAGWVLCRLEDLLPGGII
jgi:flavin reductase (DIM6/NTAB) family NADH-FMN oxidoreductase RutF